ncbi:MAG: abortive infection system antitoxin AbiGi family protein [Chthoniobacterales bacterium]
MAIRNNIHRQQLFHWIGKGIEKKSSGNGRKLDDAQREEYVSHLRISLESGLWMTKPSAEQVTVDKESFSQNLPVTCFTEWSLDRSSPHTLRYGRLGLGFPKNIILIKGGQPVSYFKSIGGRLLYASAMINLLRYFKGHQQEEVQKDLFLELQYVLSFSRAIKSPSEPHSISKTSKAPSGKKRKAIPSAKPKRTVKIDRFSRRFGLPLDLAEEREWRIVYHPELEKGKVVRKGPGKPPYLIPYKPGVELFTVALPDNRTVHMVMGDKFFRRQFFGPNRPHVTVVSIQDVGTF